MLNTKLNKAVVVAMALGCGMAMGQTAFAQSTAPSTAQSTPNTQPTPNVLHPQSVQPNGMSSGKAGNDTQRSRVWKSIDADHDGSVSRDEYMDHCNKSFVKLDVDKNGMVSQSEWQTGMMKMPRTNTGKAGMNHDEMGQSGAGRDKKADSKMNNGGMDHRGMDQQWSAMDPDHKGSVSKPDFSAYCTKMFDKMDTNSDGKLSQREWRQGMQQ